MCIVTALKKYPYFYNTMPRKIIQYNPALKQLARNLRNNSTLSEVLLWEQVKGKRIRGYDFHRQKPLLNYIVDFYCNELMLAIEIDGSSHDNKEEEDKIRQNKLESIGIRFLRIDDIEVKRNIDNVIREIEFWIDNNAGKTHP